jgi:hypothetical protein
MTSKHLTKAMAFLALALPLMLMGCEGDEGPAGPQGPPGEDASVFEFTYVGENGMACTHCHSNTVDQVMLTGHTHAYDNMDAEDQENPYCLQCHTVGWDRPVEFGDDGWMDLPNPDENGYDDYFGVEGDEAEERRMVLEGVQCENCHGPMGPDFNSHAPIVNFATIGTHDPENIQAEDFVSTCYPCHSTQFEGPGDGFDGGYGASGHASAAGGDLDAFNDEHYAHGSCGACHSNEGFIAANDPAFAGYEFGERVNFIGCVTCHDPHMGADGGGNPAQLRNISASTLSYTFPYEPDDPEAPTMEGYGNGQLCAQCHKGRRDNDNVQGQIANGYAHFGPHHSAQSDMYIGYGSYEIPAVDYSGDRSHAHQSIQTACVQCHMVRETEIHGGVEDVAFHNFRPDLGTNCSGCHPNIDEAYVTGFQATIEGLMNDLATRFGYADYHEMEENWDSQADGVEVWEREAAYAMFFLIGDGSLGVHNPSYAEKLMTEAIAYYDQNTP